MINFGKAFQNDSRAGVFITKLLRYCALSILWFVCCLPAVTVGAATVALHRAVVLTDSGEDGVFRAFFRAFRESFLQSALLMIICLILAAGLFFCFYAAASFSGAVRSIMIFVFSVPALLLAFILSYSFPLMARFETRFPAIAVDSVMLAIAFFPRTVILLLLNIFPVLVILFMPSGLVCVLFVWAPVGFALTAHWTEQCLEPVFLSVSQALTDAQSQTGGCENRKRH